MLTQVLLLSLGLSYGMALTLQPLYQYQYLQPGVTTYASMTSPPTRFWPSFCMVGRRMMAETFADFDTNGDGLVSMMEVAAASMCNPLKGKNARTESRQGTESQAYAALGYLADTEPNCKWLLGETCPISRYIDWYAEYDGHGGWVKRQLARGVLNLFSMWDKNNDNILDIDEFFGFGSNIWDSMLFYLKATRDLTDDDDDGYPDGQDSISQAEWNCAQNEDEEGLLPSKCNLDYDGISMDLTKMPGNNGDDKLTLYEFIWVYGNMLSQAKNSPYFNGYCKNWKVPFFGDKINPNDDVVENQS